MLQNALMVDDRDFRAGRLVIKPRSPVYGSGEDGGRTYMSVKVSFLPLILVVFLAVSALPAENSGNMTVVINELMANNAGSVRDQNGDSDDWIEIYNIGNSAVNIGGMYLTDSQSAVAGWRVPDNNPAVTLSLIHI